VTIGDFEFEGVDSCTYLESGISCKQRNQTVGGLHCKRMTANRVYRAHVELLRPTVES